MDKKEEFKKFVKDNPILINRVKDNTMSWQKFYEIYDLYGADEKAWSEYLNPSVRSEKSKGGFVDWLKAIDLDVIGEGVASLQRVVGVIGDMTNKDKKDTPKSEYKPRPIYKHFDD